MQSSFLDMFPPQMQAQLGLIAAIVTLAGLVLWSAGIRIARATVAFLFGGAAATLAAWLLPQPTGLAQLPCGIVGFVAGLLLGVLAFRLLQGLTLALCFGLAVAGIYDRWHLNPPLLAAATTHAATRAVEAAAVETATRIATQPASPATLDVLIHAFRDRLIDLWNSIPLFHRQRIGVFALAAAVIALFVALSAQRHTTWIITALIGALLLLSGTFALLHIYAPQYQFIFSSSTLPRYSLLAVVTLIGMLIQRLVFWPKPPPTPLYRIQSPIPNVMPPSPPPGT